MSGTVFQTSLRLNLENDEDRRAWEHLVNIDRTRYKSYTRLIVAAVNSYFERRDRMEAAFSSEKEDAFLQRVLETVERGIRESLSAGLDYPPAAQLSAPKSVSREEVSKQEMDNAALEFVESL